MYAGGTGGGAGTSRYDIKDPIDVSNATRYDIEDPIDVSNATR